MKSKYYKESAANNLNYRVDLSKDLHTLSYAERDICRQEAKKYGYRVTPSKSCVGDIGGRFFLYMQKIWRAMEK